MTSSEPVIEVEGMRMGRDGDSVGLSMGGEGGSICGR